MADLPFNINGSGWMMERFMRLSGGFDKLPRKQAERLKSRERRPEVNRLYGQWVGLMVDRLDGCYA